jgi:uncharacterized protein (TIGR02391 family)
MPEWYFIIAGLLRGLRRKAWDARQALEDEDSGAAKVVNAYMKAEYQKLGSAWEAAGFAPAELGSLGRHIHFGMDGDYNDILKFDIAGIEEHLDRHVREHKPKTPSVGFENLLHPIVKNTSMKHFIEGDYRNAVLDGMLALSDLIRERTGLHADGKALATEAFSLARPKLIFSELHTESGQNDQKGFMEMIAGAYTGIRNPKAHSLIHDLDKTKAAQYLVAISLLVRRVADAKDAS